MIRALHYHDHLPKSIIGQLHHKMDVFILLFRKFQIRLPLAIDGTRQVITAVTDTFYLRHFTQHSPDLQFTLRAQTSFRHLVQVVRNLQLHTVTDVLVFFYPAKQLIEIIILIGMQQIAYHAKHTMSTFGKQVNFFACLQNRKFRCGKHTARNKTQAIFFVLFFLRNDGTDRTFYKLHEPYQDQHITYIEACMESRQFK